MPYFEPSLLNEKVRMRLRFDAGTLPATPARALAARYRTDAPITDDSEPPARQDRNLQSDGTTVLSTRVFPAIGLASKAIRSTMQQARTNGNQVTTRLNFVNINVAPP